MLAGVIPALIVVIIIVTLASVVIYQRYRYLSAYATRLYAKRAEAVARVHDLERLADAEYSRAMDEGKRMVREWAVEANYNLYGAEGSGMYVPKVRAAFQDAIGQFRPRNWRSIQS